MHSALSSSTMKRLIDKTSIDVTLFLYLPHSNLFRVAKLRVIL